MNEKMRKLMEQRAAAIQGMREIVDKADKEERDLSPEERAQYDAAENALSGIDQRIDREQKLTGREAELRGSANGSGNPNPGMGGEVKQGTASPEYRSAFLGYARGQGGFERRALQIGTDSEGGYLCPDEYEKKLIDTATDENVMRQLGTVIQSDSGDRKIPVVASHGSAVWMDEEAAFTESDDAFSVVTLGAHKVGTIIKVSEELLADSAFDVESYLANEFGRRIGAAEQSAFLVGNGTGKPTGITASADTGVTAASTTAITADELLDLVYSLKSKYRTRASFIMNDAMLKQIRKLKDGNGQYIWQPSFAAGQPDSLLSYKLYTASDMPAAEASAKVIAFGDYKYYWISDRKGKHFQRLNELYAANGQVGFKGWQRVDGKLMVPEAVKLLTMGA